MPKEYEYRFCFDSELTEELLRKKLLKVKAIHYKPVLFIIQTFTNPMNKEMYIRLRDEGFQKTFTIKQNLKNKFVDEYEIIIDNINIAHQMLLLLGCVKKYEVQKIREIYKVNDVEIVLDSYPGLPTYFEIEAPTLNKLNNFCKLIDIDIKNHLKHRGKISYDSIYNLPKNRNINGDLTFKNAKKYFYPIINKNKNLFNITLKKQKELLKSL